MKTIRDLAERAYTASQVLGRGMQMSGDNLANAINILEVILLEEFVEGLPVSKQQIYFQFNGARNYTIGTEARIINGVSISPDILVDSLPDDLDIINLLSNRIRYECNPMTANDYYSRASDVTTSPRPKFFYYNRQGYGNTFPTINFIGLPALMGEISYTATLDGFTSNSDLKLIPKALIPYLVHELSFRLADENGLQGVRQKAQSNRAHALYVDSCTNKPTYLVDKSKSLATGDKIHSYDAVRGERQILSGEV